MWINSRTREAKDKETAGEYILPIEEYLPILPVLDAKPPFGAPNVLGELCVDRCDRQPSHMLFLIALNCHIVSRKSSVFSNVDRYENVRSQRDRYDSNISNNYCHVQSQRNGDYTLRPIRVPGSGGDAGP